MSDPIRTRFAPSPTGHLHIGNARTALMNWLAARHAGGKLILRIEDTDQERSTQTSEDSILEDLRWLGLDWDEGPDLKGTETGPYRQSERLQIYGQTLEMLLREGHVYPCYCTAEELEERRKLQMEKGEQPHYDGRCLGITDSEKKKWQKEGRKPSFRFHVTADSVSFRDLVKGEISVKKDALGDFVIARQDGMPMYNFACVVDDHFMNISHVIRGDDHVSNTPRQILMYQAMGWKIPHFAHIPMILGKDRNRLSKRHGATSVSQFREMGYLPDALVNFLSLLSWSSESGEEVLSRKHLIREFSFERISRAASVFDTEKLDWMNGIYIREKTSIHELARIAGPFFSAAGYQADEQRIETIIVLLQNKMEKLSEIPEKAGFIFQETVSPENEESASLIQNAESQTVFHAFLSAIESLESWDGEIFASVMKSVQQVSGIKGKGLWMPVRVALTGQMHGPELGPVAQILGLETCRNRIRQALG